MFQEGVYVDDLIIGFPKRGETWRDDSPPLPNGPDPFINDSDPANLRFITVTDTNVVGEYQVELRPSSSVMPGALDARDRHDLYTSLIAPAGREVFDGKTFSIGDGLQTVVFEYEDLTIGDGVADRHVAIEFEVADLAHVMAVKIRDAINSDPVQAQLQILAALSDGIVVGPGTTTNRVDLFGNAIVSVEESPHGIATVELDPNRFGDSNTQRDQGQIILHSNTITHSAQYGIIVEDGLRDLPEYGFYDVADIVKHAQFTYGDYIPHAGAVRNLSEINQEALAPGVTISNNVLAFNGEGGIRFGGDPNGFLLFAPVAHPSSNPPLFEVNDVVPYKYSRSRIIMA